MHIVCVCMAPRFSLFHHASHALSSNSIQQGPSLIFGNELEATVGLVISQGIYFHIFHKFGKLKPLIFLPMGEQITFQAGASSTQGLNLEQAS